MKLLKTLLWIIGVICLVPIIFIFVPWSGLNSVTASIGIDAIPRTPLLMYSLKVCFGVAGLIGVFFILLALNPMENERMLVLGAFGLGVFGLLGLILGLVFGVDRLVFIGDAVFGIVLGVVIIGLYIRQKIIS